MKKNSIFQLGEYCYSSKKVLIASIQNYLARTNDGEVSHPETIQKLHYLLLMHPKAKYKIGVGVKKFLVTSNELGSGKGFEILRYDNTKERFSYKTCINGQKQTQRSKSVEALRFSIRQQMIDFRKSLKLPLNCAISGLPIHHHDEIHIDHRIPFWELVLNFLHEYNYSLIQLETCGSGEYLKLIDENIIKEFYFYHKKTAILQPTLIKYNIEKSGRASY